MSKDMHLSVRQHLRHETFKTASKVYSVGTLKRTSPVTASVLDPRWEAWTCVKFYSPVAFNAGNTQTHRPTSFCEKTNCERQGCEEFTSATRQRLEGETERDRATVRIKETAERHEMVQVPDGKKNWTKENVLQEIRKR